MKRAVLYLRRSHKDATGDSISLELQEDACRQHCQSRGYRVVDVITDAGISGRTLRRPGVQQAITAVETNTADVVVLWRWSRLTRNRLHLGVILDKIHVAGGEVESATEPVDTTTAAGRFARGMLAEFAEFESEVKSEQWKDAQARRRRLGLPHGGGIPFGYQRGDGDVFVVHPEHGALLREAYLRFIRGAGALSTARWLNSNGAKTRRGYDWTAQSVLRSLDTGFGAGLLHLHSTGEYLRGAHPPVISDEEWQRYRHKRVDRRVLTPRLRQAVYMLSGLVYCDSCGAAAIAASTGRGRGYMYRCSKQFNAGTCAGFYLARPNLERMVLSWINDHIAELLADDARVCKEVALREEVRTLSSRVVDLDAALTKLTVDLATGVVPTPVYERARDQLRLEREQLVDTLAGVEIMVRRVAPVDDYQRHLLADGGTESPGEMRDAISQVVAGVYVGTGTVRIARRDGAANATIVRRPGRIWRAPAADAGRPAAPGVRR